MAAIHDAKVAPGPTADSPCRVEEALGRFSSHPRWSAYQLRLWYLIAFAPLFAGAWVFGRYVLSDADAAVTMLVDYGRPLLLYGAAAAGFAAGLSLTAAIATQARRCRRIVDDAGAPAWIFVAAIFAMVMIALSMLVLSLSLDLPPRARSLVTCLGILPLVMIQSLLQVTIRAEGSDGRPVTGKFKPWTAILPAIPVAFVLASQVEAVSRRLGSIDFVQRVIDMVGGGLPGVDPDVLRRWVVTVLVGSLASPFVAWATAMMMRLWRSDDSAEAGERPQDGTAVFPLLGERLPLAASIESAGAAEQGAGSEPASDPGPERLREEFVRDPLVVSLLGGHAPWPGQAEHVQGIVDAARRSRRQDPDAPPWERASMDFIVEGESGSGRTAAVVAAVLHGVICEGDRAIFFVPDESGVESLEKRVRVALAAIGLDALMSVETLTPESVARWMGPSSGVATPAVMIGTPLQFERAFFEGTSTPERRGEVLRRIGMVIVEDLEAYGFDELVHLPFILHKFRLFLAATGDTCRTVVVTLPLTPAGRSLVRGRLCDARRAAPRTAVGGSASAPPASPAAAPRVVPFASRASTPLFVQHVCSVARLLPRRHPIHRSWWNACGLPEDRQLRSGAIAEPGDGMEILSDREVVLDPRIRHGLPPDDAVVHNAAAPTWPWAVADGPDAAPRPLPVGIGEPIDAGAGYLLDEDGLRLTPVISIPRPDGRIAVIRDQAMVLGRIDLAYMTRMVWRSLGTRYTFRRIFTDGDSTTIEGVPEMEREPGPDHAILALPGIEWPTGVVAEDCGLSTGPCRGRISMYTIGQGAAPSATRWSFTGRYDDRGRIVHISPQVEYSCESSVFVLLLEAPADRRDAATVGKDVLEAWRLVGDHATPTHVPELGAAVAAALASLARGLEQFARCIGLRLPGGHDAAAWYAVLFVEPETTAGSARECLLEMLMDRGSAARFLQEVAAALAAESADAGVPFVRSDYAVAPNVSGAAIAADAATVSALRALIASLATEVA